MGSWVDGEQNGHGKMLFPDGEVYEGQWSENRKNGQGTFRFSNGDVHCGTYRDDMMNGEGTMTYSDGTIFKGTWLNDQQVGFEINDAKIGNGEMKYSNGDCYIGGWMAGKKCGNGRMNYADGSYYEGDWCNDEYHGKGVYRYPPGIVVYIQIIHGHKLNRSLKGHRHESYTGDFRRGRKHGTGTLVYGNGDVYRGRWSNDHKHGKVCPLDFCRNPVPNELSHSSTDRQGSIEHAVGGQVFKGVWDHGKKMGPGTYTFPNGDKFSGEWTGKSLFLT